jgi:hypothetical protein
MTILDYPHTALLRKNSTAIRLATSTVIMSKLTIKVAVPRTNVKAYEAELR